MPLPLLLIATATTTLTLADYVAAYRDHNPSRQTQVLDVRLAQVEVERRTNRATRTLSVSPQLGARGYHLTRVGSFDPLLSAGADAEYSYDANDGTGYSFRAGVAWPSRSNLPAGNPQYGVEGAYRLPLVRNFGGRQNRYEQDAAKATKDGAVATLDEQDLMFCADATERYLVRYAAEQQLATYDELIEEKRRVWAQTIRDYERKMIQRLDLLAARSDWLAAQSLRARFVARKARADAALEAFLDGPAPPLAPPPAIVAATPPKTATIAATHPRLVRLAAMQRELEQTALLAQERGRDDVELAFTVGATRVHDLFVPPQEIADLTDIYGLVRLTYLWPIERPETDYQAREARLRLERVAAERRALAIELTQQIREQLELWRHTEEAHRLLEEQRRVMLGQIRAAHREFSNGKMEFQDYLDHWDRHQRARLDAWDLWLETRLAENRLVPLLGTLPEHCL